MNLSILITTDFPNIDPHRLGVVILILAGIISVIMLFKYLARPHSTYRRERNPYRRYCKACGQCQVQFQYAGMDHGPSWWIAMGHVHDEKCKCHKDAKYDQY